MLSLHCPDLYSGHVTNDIHQWTSQQRKSRLKRSVPVTPEVLCQNRRKRQPGLIFRPLSRDWPQSTRYSLSNGVQEDTAWPLSWQEVLIKFFQVQEIHIIAAVGMIQNALLALWKRYMNTNCMDKQQMSVLSSYVNYGTIQHRLGNVHIRHPHWRCYVSFPKISPEKMSFFNLQETFLCLFFSFLS